MLKIVKFEDIDETSWDNYVMQHSESNYCQLSGWYHVISKTYGHRAYYLAAVENSSKSNKKKISGVLPLIQLRHFLFGNELVSMPFFDIGGILADDVAAEKCLAEKAFEISTSIGAKSLELRYSHESPLFSHQNNCSTAYPTDVLNSKHSIINEIQFNVMRHKVRMILHLPASSNELMKSFKSKLRSQIRKPIKEGLTYKIGKQELLDDFYSVFCQNMRDLGSPVHSNQLMQNILSCFEETYITVVYKENLPLAASFTFGYKNMLSNPWASALRQHSRLSPNMLLYWAMLEFACKEGYQIFDFGRSTPDEGTYNFKKQWGAEPHPLYWISLNSGKKMNRTEKSSEKSQFQEKAIEVWKKLPISVTLFLGPKIRKYISL